MDLPRGTVEWLQKTLESVQNELEEMRVNGYGKETDTFRLAFLSGHVSALNNAMLRELDRDSAITAERAMQSA